MFKRLRASKILNIAALVSLLSSIFTLAPMLPALAITEPLESLTTTLAQPIFSEDWNTIPSYSNVSYSWAMSKTFYAESGDPCLTSEDCFKIFLNLEDTGTTTTYQGQEWMDTVSTLDIDWNGPAEIYVSSLLRIDLDTNGRYEMLELILGCTTDCAMTTSTVYSLDIVNYPIKNQQEPITYVQGVYSTTTHTFEVNSNNSGSPVIPNEILTSVVAVGKGVTVTTNVEPSLTFYIEGAEAASFYGEPGDEFINNSAADDTCDFGTLTPGVPKYCNWLLAIATNASNGYSIYVVQDQDMTFNGNTIKQFYDGARSNYTEASTWSSPSPATMAHLGYSSSDTSVFPLSFGSARWAGIPTIADDTEAPVTTGLVCDSPSPSEGGCSYAIKVESASTLPQGTNYTHNEYFLVVGNF